MTLKYDKLFSELLNKHSFLAVFTIGILLASSVTASNLAFADVIAPNKQLDWTLRHKR
jgi:hypothetical protein